MTPIKPANEFTATVPVANNGEHCAHGERLATAQALTNRTHNLNERLKPVEALTLTGEGLSKSFTEALEGLGDLVLPDYKGLNNVIKSMGEGLASWTKWAIQRIPGLAQNNQSLCFPLIPVGGLTPTWQLSWFGSTPLLAQNILDAQPLFLALPLPRWGYLKSVTLYCRGGSAHTAIPATRPRLSIGRYTTNFGGAHSVDEIGAADDPSADVTAYELDHIINVSFSTGVPLGAAPFLHFQAKVTGESGANAVVSEFFVSAIVATISGLP